VRKALVMTPLQLGVFLHIAAFNEENILNPAKGKNKTVQKILLKWFKKENLVEKILTDLGCSDYKP